MELSKPGEPITVGTEAHAFLVQHSNEALRITTELNISNHEPAEVRALFSQLTGKEVDESCFIFRLPIRTAAETSRLGKNVFLNIFNV